MNAQVQAVDFTSFVFASNDDIKTTSLFVAEKFGKRHDDVLKKLRNLECSAEFHARNFAEMFQTIEIGNGATRQSAFYEMTKDGFMFLVMGFTGKAAAQIKEAYINAFNLMHAKLFPKHATTPQTPSGLSELLSANLTAQQKIIMMILGQNADANGECQMSLTELAPLCGIQRSTTSKNLTDLIADGFLSVIKSRCQNGGSLPNTYVIPERFRVVSGELVDEAPAALEYMPPEGMVLVAENELESLRHKANSKTVQQPIAPEGYAVVPLDFIKKYEERGKIIDNVRFYINA